MIARPRRVMSARLLALLLGLAVLTGGCWWTDDEPECVSRADPTPCSTCPVTTFRTTCPD